MATSNDAIEKKSFQLEMSPSFVGMDSDTDEDEIIHYFISNRSEEGVDDKLPTNVSDKDHSLVQSTVNEHVLSQQLSQLSTTHQQSQMNKRKHASPSQTEQALLDDDGDDEIPAYLSTTNKSFEQIMQQIPRDSMHIDELQQIALLLDQSTRIELEKSLWSAYFQVGTGTLKPEQPGPGLWPTVLKSIVLTSAKNSSTNDDMEDRCLTLVHTRLRRLNHKQQQCQDQLQAKTNSLDPYKTIIESTLQSYIQQHLQSLHAHYQYTIALIGDEYEEHRLELEFLAQDPNENQIDLFQCLCHRKYEQEKAKHDYLLLKEQVIKNRLPDAFYSNQLPLPSLIETIADMNLRRSLYEQQRKLILNYRNEMKTIYIQMAEMYMFQTQNLFDQDINTMRENQKTFPIHQQWNPMMLTILDQRLSTTAEKVHRIYNYKMDRCFGQTSTA